MISPHFAPSPCPGWPCLWMHRWIAARTGAWILRIPALTGSAGDAGPLCGEKGYIVLRSGVMAVSAFGLISPVEVAHASAMAPRTTLVRVASLTGVGESIRARIPRRITFLLASRKSLSLNSMTARASWRRKIERSRGGNLRNIILGRLNGLLCRSRSCW